MSATAETVKEKVKTKTKVKSDDALVSISNEIENLSAEEAIAAVPGLLETADENYFRLGGVLSRISTGKLYESKGHETFKTFVEAEYGIQYRKAMYWLHIYDSLIESKVPWEKVKEIGWTKLKDLAGVLSPDNVDEWVKRAKESTTLQLQELIAKAKEGKLETSGLKPVNAAKSDVTTVTVKVHKDQKDIIKQALEKAKKEANTEFDGVALEGICTNYLSGGNVTAKPPALADVMSKCSPEEAIAAFEKAFPEFQLIASLKKKEKKTEQAA
jgi:hypothetical protein